jgi:hypothetical protein
MSSLTPAATPPTRQLAFLIADPDAAAKRIDEIRLSEFR